MSVEEDPVPPIPQVEPPIDEASSAGKRFTHAWMRWFDTVRRKINVINALVVGFSKLVGVGFPALNGTAWALRTMSGGDGVDVANGDGVAGDPTFTFNADTGRVAHIIGSTFDSVQDYIDVMTSPGLITGGIVTALNPTNVRITASTILIRIADDNVSTLRFANVPQADFAVPDVQVTHFYAVDYSGGTPVYVEASVDAWDRDTQIPVGSAFRLDGALNVTPNPYRTGDVDTNFIQRLDAIGPVQRDNSVGGLLIGVAGVRNVTVSAGRLWARVSDFTVSAKDSSVDTMFTAFFNGVNLTITGGATQWDNLQFNDLGTGSLQVLGNNKYATLWLFMSFDGTKYGFAYGVAEHNTLGDASLEGIPPYLTQNFFNQAVLLGRFVFQKSAATPSIIESAFTTGFVPSAINNHNDLAGLQDAPNAVVNEHYHMNSAQATGLNNANFEAFTATTDYNDLLGPRFKAYNAANTAANAPSAAFYNGMYVGNNATSGITLAVRLTSSDANREMWYRASSASVHTAWVRLWDGQNLPQPMTLDTAQTTTAAGVKTFTSEIRINGAAATNRIVRFRTSGLDRWNFSADLTPEAGANSGSDFLVGRYDDAGTFIATAFRVARSNGISRWNGNMEPFTNLTYTNGSSSARWTTVFTQNLDQSGARFETGVVSPAQLVANTDNWVVAGLSTLAIIRATTDASRNLTGIASPTNGQMVRLINVGTQDLVLVHDATSTAANRFLLPNSANLTLNPNDSVSLWYDNTSSRWRALGV